MNGADGRCARRAGNRARYGMDKGIIFVDRQGRQIYLRTNAA